MSIARSKASLRSTRGSEKRSWAQRLSFTVSGTYSNGDVKGMTQKVDYISSNPNIVATGVDPLSKSKVQAKAPGTAVIGMGVTVRRRSQR